MPCRARPSRHSPATLRALEAAADLAVERGTGRRPGTPTRSSASRPASSPPRTPPSPVIGTAARTPRCPASSADVPVAVLVIDQRTNAVVYAEHRRGRARRQRAAPGRRRHLGCRGRPDRPRRGPARQQQRPALDGRAGPAGHRRGGAALARHQHRADRARRRPGGRRPAALGHRVPAVAGRQRRAARAGRVPAAGPAGATPTTRMPTCRRCASARSSPPTSRSPSPIRGSRTTRWSGSTRPSPGSPATRPRRSSAATAASCRGRRPTPPPWPRSATALAEQRTVTTTLLNYRKDGTAFWNQLSVSPVFDGEGRWSASSACRPTSPSGCGWSTSGRRPSPRSRPRGGRPNSPGAIAEQARSDAERAQSRRRARPGPPRADGRGHEHADRHPRHVRAARPARGLCVPRLGRLGLRHAARRLRRRARVRRPPPGRPRRRTGRSSPPSTCCTWAPARRAGGAWRRPGRCCSTS